MDTTGDEARRRPLGLGWLKGLLKQLTGTERLGPKDGGVCDYRCKNFGMGGSQRSYLVGIEEVLVSSFVARKGKAVLRVDEELRGSFCGSYFHLVILK